MSPRAVLALAVALLSPTAVRAEALDEALYARLLERHTRATDDLARTRVDYQALARSDDWRRLLRNVSRTDPAALASRAERLAYWINVYNILAIDVVVQHRPVESIRDVGSFFRPVWKVEAGLVAGRPVTLHEIEHQILRPMGDPRIHAAIVCASLSCPALRREPWTAGRLEAQFDDTLRAWMADRRKGLAVDRAAGVVTLSKIFDWFAGDFAEAGGVLAFVARHAPAQDAAWLASHGDDAALRYFDYDWSLNGIR